ncbi:MAG: ankyrin repeat domain-containing protein [Chloroflexi bacterium]|nr:ankyrin repeat domain-containing protein [Chloroflexota bacterium]
MLEFVLSAHRDFDRVQKMVDYDPRLINASCDMGGGDWESALDAAAHMGQAEIARHLIEQGARLDLLYLCAMLDEVEIVQAILAAFPSARHTPGVHGFSLRHFAKKGGAERVLAYLESLDD